MLLHIVICLQFGYIIIINVAPTITNGPLDTTVCNGSIASISCGYVHVDPNFIVPEWSIVDDEGNVMTITGVNIISNTDDGLEWLQDTTSGDNNATNSRLLVGPVDETDNHSSYQCIVSTFLSGTVRSVRSSIGTLTVAGTYICTWYENLCVHT